MLNIQIPDNNTNERKYIIDVLIKHYLGLDYSINIDPDIKDYQITTESGNTLIIEDHFFNSTSNYLRTSNIPEKVEYLDSSYLIDNNLPILYGKAQISESENKICLQADIFASAFFMLSRWEEYVLDEEHKQGRPDEEKMLSVMLGFDKRPIVCEYTELLWKLVHKLGCTQNRNKLEYRLTITHDVDEFIRYTSFSKYLKACVGDIILRKKPLNIYKTTIDYLKTAKNYKNDPYYTFDYIMDISKKYNNKSLFYFIPSEKGEYDYRYSIGDDKVVKCINNIIERGHKVGIHGSFNSYNNELLFTKELNRLRNNFKITEGRQHYLRFDCPNTWLIHENNNIKHDSTIGFYDRIGFRAGTCWEYPVFDVISKRTLDLIEYPLIIMERALTVSNPTAEEFITSIFNIAEIVRKYNGNLVYLWHTNNINNTAYKNYSSHYESIIAKIS